MERIIMHIDVNNAFLSWSALYLLKQGYQEDIRNIDAVIGGDETRRSGIVLAKSTSAKKKGIVTAETLYSARKKCPGVQIFPPNYLFYQENSQKLFKLLSKYTPDIEIASIDECYLDYTKVKNLYGNPIDFANKLKQEIKDTLHFTVNIGIANNKLCAKMASDFSKPNKIHTLFENEIKEKLYPLDVRDLFGIGKMTALKLNMMGINTIEQLASASKESLTRIFKNQGIIYIQMAQGIDNSLVVSEKPNPDSISNETTLIEDVTAKEKLYSYLMALSDNTSLRLRQEKKYTSVIAVIIKNNYFKRKTHQKKLKNATNITSEIYKISKEILDEMWEQEPVRLIGLRLDGLVENVTFQTSLFESGEENQKEEKIDQIIDELNEKFGTTTIKKASLLDSKVGKKYL